MKGRFYGIGVGPGDPELLTMKAYRILNEVELIASPTSSDGRESIAFSIVEKGLDRRVKKLKLLFPMTRQRDELELHWGKAVTRILEELEAGKDVAFVTLGDPMLYSTYCYVVRKLKEYPDIRITTVPGITSISACAAAFNVPLAEGDETVAVLPGMCDPSQLEEVLRWFDNVVLMKISSNYAQIAEVLKKLELTESSFFASRLGHAGEYLSREIENLVDRKKDYLSLMIIKQRRLEEIEGLLRRGRSGRS